MPLRQPLRRARPEQEGAAGARLSEPLKAICAYRSAVRRQGPLERGGQRANRALCSTVLAVLIAGCTHPKGSDLFSDKACGGLNPPARATSEVVEGADLTAAKSVASDYVDIFGNVDAKTDSEQWLTELRRLTAGAAADALPDRPQDHLNGAKQLQSTVVAMEPLRASATEAAFLAKVEERRKGSVRQTTYRAFYTLTLKRSAGAWHATGVIYESQGPC